MQLVQTVREYVRSLLEKCHVAYGVIPFDEDLHQDCLEDAMRRGYPVDDPLVRACLRVGVLYGATAGVHLHRPAQIWSVLYTTYITVVDDMPDHHPAELHNIYLFNDRFIKREPQGNGPLAALADIIRRASDFFQPIASHLVITSSLNFVTGTLLEHETRSMKVLSAAGQFANYQRSLSGTGEAYGFMGFPQEIPLSDYIQAIPEIALFARNINDVLSFYKEEVSGDTSNQISVQAARTQKSKLEIFGELTDTTIDLYSSIVKFLEETPEACEAFKRFAAGLAYFHTSSSRYRLEDLCLY